MPRPRREMPWLDTRDNGFFYVFWYDADARRTRYRSLDTKDGAVAQVAYAQFLLNGRTIYEPASEEGPTVAVCLDFYLKEHAEQNCAAPRRQHDAARHLKAFFADTLMADVDIAMSRKYVQARVSGKIGGGSRRTDKRGSPPTIRRELNVLVAAANHAVKWKRLTKDKLPSVELPPHSSGKTPWYSRKELEVLMAAADGHLLRFIRLAYFTGARKASIEHLTIDQINFTGKTINLQKMGERRTIKRRPFVPLYAEILPDIVWLLDEGDGKALFGDRDFYRPFRELCERAGLADKAHPHILRHTRATHLLLAGVSIYDVAKLLGDTVATVERTYAHACSEHLAASTSGK